MRAMGAGRGQGGDGAMIGAIKGRVGGCDKGDCDGEGHSSSHGGRAIGVLGGL